MTAMRTFPPPQYMYVFCMCIHCAYLGRPYYITAFDGLIQYTIKTYQTFACMHAWWSTLSWLATLLSSFIARRWVGLQTL